MTDVDALAISHLDIFGGMMTAYGLVGLDTLPKPVIIEAYGPRREDRIFV